MIKDFSYQPVQVQGEPVPILWDNLEVTHLLHKKKFTSSVLLHAHNARTAWIELLGLNNSAWAMTIDHIISTNAIHISITHMAQHMNPKETNLT